MKITLSAIVASSHRFEVIAELIGYQILTLDLTDFRFIGKQKASKVVLKALEASHDHLLVPPPSHFTARKVRGFVVGFTWLRGIRTI
jgi:putative hemolysin